MRFKQVNPQPIRQKYRLYSPSALTNAYKQVKDNGMSVKRASKTFGVPDTTLRDRILNKIDPETVIIGKAPLFDLEEEVKLVNHVKVMAGYGYGYSRQECVDVASDYAVQIGKRQKDQPLTMKWMRGFLKRWPELRVLKPRGLEHLRAKMASESIVTEYFDNLQEVLEEHDLVNKPHLIYNVDEKGISVDHTPPHIVASSAYCPPAVTSGRGKNVTLLGCGSASGVAVPPFFIFPGKRMNPELLDGASPGTDGTVSESGWSNGAIFRQYLESHFLKHVPGRDQKILLLLDGHKSHVSVGLSEWAQQHGIILFILPAHTSHLLQPLDVSCYGPLEKVYNSLSHRLMKETSATITRYNVCKLACEAYKKALSPENVQSGFRRAGIFPLNPAAVPREHLLPAEVFTGSTVEDGTPAEEQDITHLALDQQDSSTILENKENQLKELKRGHSKKPRKTLSKIVSGRALTDEVLIQMKAHETQSNKSQKPRSGRKSSTASKCTTAEKNADIPPTTVEDDPQPGPSHFDNQASQFDSDITDELDDNDRCCVCNRFSPENVTRMPSVRFTDWAQCDGIRDGQPCLHWVHLVFCTPVRSVSEADVFLCRHCQQEE